MLDRTTNKKVLFYLIVPHSLIIHPSSAYEILQSVCMFQYFIIQMLHLITNVYTNNIVLIAIIIHYFYETNVKQAEQTFNSIYNNL